MGNFFSSLMVVSLVLVVVFSGHLQGSRESISESGAALSDPYQIGYRLPEDAVVTYPSSNPLREALRPIPKTAVFKMEGWSLWDPSLIKVGETYHLFCSRWPKSEDYSFDSGWKRSHVIRATSKNLFGPYEFAEVVLHPSKHPWANQGISSTN